MANLREALRPSGCLSPDMDGETLIGTLIGRERMKRESRRFLSPGERPFASSISSTVYALAFRGSLLVDNLRKIAPRREI